MLSSKVSVESQLSFIAGGKYLQAGMCAFICFDMLWEVLSEGCFEKAQCHLPLIFFGDHQTAGKMNRLSSSTPLQGAGGPSLRCTESQPSWSFLSLPHLSFISSSSFPLHSSFFFFPSLFQTFLFVFCKIRNCWVVGQAQGCMCGCVFGR